MATTGQPRRRHGHAAGAGEAASVDALHPHGRLRRRRRDADHRPRRGLLRLGRARQPLSRRPCVAVLRRTSATAVPTSAQAGAEQARRARLLLDLVLRAPAGDRAGGEDRSLTPGDLNRVFFTTRRQRGGRVGAEARRGAYHSSPATEKTKVIAREVAYHGTSLGRALATGITALRTPFEPLTPGGSTCPTRTSTAADGATGRRSPRPSRDRILFEGRRPSPR